MPESPEDKFDRVQMMINDDGTTWDLSPKDKDALEFVLKMAELAMPVDNKLPTDRNKADWIIKHGSDRLKMLLEEGIEFGAVYRDECCQWIRERLPEGWCLASDYIGGELKEPRNSTEDDLEMLASCRLDQRDQPELFDSKPVLKYTCVFTGSNKKADWCGSVVFSVVQGEAVLFGVPARFVKVKS